MSDDELSPEAAEARGLTMLAETGAAIVAGVAREAPAWVVGAVARLLDAWGRADDVCAARWRPRAARRGAAQRVGERLAALLATDPADQRATPLEIVRTVYREPTEILVAAGVPPGRAGPVRRAGLARGPLRPRSPDAGRPRRPRSRTAPPGLGMAKADGAPGPGPGGEGPRLSPPFGGRNRCGFPLRVVRGRPR